jgi:hypothetical protein
MISYNLSLINIGVGINASLNYNKVKMVTGESINKGFTVGASKGLMEGKVNLGLSVNFTNSKVDNIETTVITPRFTARGKFGKHHSLRLKLTLISNSNNNNNQQSYTEEIGDLSYVFTF